jgi:lipopolysaccharide/colanic/teichoic acid biosynthesis glycosyltransferase
MSSGRPTPAKRTFDVVVAGLALLLLWPVLVMIAIAVRLDSPGPVLFRQVRIGRDGVPFVMLKFRTMVVDASVRSANVSADGDPRVTRTGRVLRHWYLDELPQLLNVLSGSMSMVGPRPETPEFVALLDADERRVLSVRAGLVGPSTLGFMDEAQVLAAVPDPLRYYTGTMLHERVREDLHYLDEGSLRYDLCLLSRQAWAILRRL